MITKLSFSLSFVFLFLWWWCCLNSNEHLFKVKRMRRENKKGNGTSTKKKEEIMKREKSVQIKGQSIVSNRTESIRIKRTKIEKKILRFSLEWQ